MHFVYKKFDSEHWIVSRSDQQDRICLNLHPGVWFYTSWVTLIKRQIDIIRQEIIHSENTLHISSSKNPMETKQWICLLTSIVPSLSKIIIKSTSVSHINTLADMSIHYHPHTHCCLFRLNPSHIVHHKNSSGQLSEEITELFWTLNSMFVRCF